jgi:hypothetical protein
MGALAFIGLGLEILPKLISAGIQVAGFIGVLRGVSGKDAVTAEDWQALHSMERELRLKLHSDTE